jgi:hypothetical protein
MAVFVNELSLCRVIGCGSAHRANSLRPIACRTDCRSREFRARGTHYDHGVSSIMLALTNGWPPAVVAAFVASGVTFLGTVVRDSRQRKRDTKSAATKSRSAAYGDLLARSMSLAHRAQTIRSMLPLRSGLEEGVSVVLRLRKPLDAFDLHDWLDKDMAPLTDAWSQVWTVGSQKGVDAADELMNACADLVAAATQHDESRERGRTTVRGIVWTPAEIEAYDETLKVFAEQRVAFARLMRQEMGAPTVEFALERARKKAAEHAIESEAALETSAATALPSDQSKTPLEGRLRKSRTRNWPSSSEALAVITATRATLRKATASDRSLCRICQQQPMMQSLIPTHPATCRRSPP